jgi:glycosyltransferase involved in cell wall biosynthesis
MTAFQRPIVSVIIPFLNGSHWLIEAIESVINQSYSDWEVIVVDDGSEEEHSKIARDYSFRYPEKIIYTDHPGHINRGVTISRNLGISLTKGEYIALLDADDFWLPQKLQNQLELFDLHPEAGMICEASRFWYSWEKPTDEDVIKNVGTEPDKLYDPPQLTYRLYPLGEGASPCPSGIIFKKHVFKRSGGFEESFTGIYQGYEDQAFLCKIYLHEKVFISGAANNLYRKRSGSMSGFVHNEKLYYQVREFFLNWLEVYLKQHAIENSKVLKLIEKARFEMKDFLK